MIENVLVWSVITGMLEGATNHQLSLASLFLVSDKAAYVKTWKPPVIFWDL